MSTQAPATATASAHKSASSSSLGNAALTSRHCPPQHCTHPARPLPPANSQLHINISTLIAQAIEKYYDYSLAFLATGEVIEWVETNRTVDAWILTGLEQGRPPSQVGNDTNVRVGKTAIMSVVKAALEQDNNAWADGLREVAFLTSLKMLFTSLTTHLSLSRAPCLHLLLQPSTLTALQTLPLPGPRSHLIQSPSRPFPSFKPLLKSILGSIEKGSLKGRWYPSPQSLRSGGAAGRAGPNNGEWRKNVENAFRRYHEAVRKGAEVVVLGRERVREARRKGARRERFLTAGSEFGDQNSGHGGREHGQEGEDGDGSEGEEEEEEQEEDDEEDEEEDDYSDEADSHDSSADDSSEYCCSSPSHSHSPSIGLHVGYSGFFKVLSLVPGASIGVWAVLLSELSPSSGTGEEGDRMKALAREFCRGGWTDEVVKKLEGRSKGLRERQAAQAAQLQQQGQGPTSHSQAQAQAQPHAQAQSQPRPPPPPTQPVQGSSKDLLRPPLSYDPFAATAPRSVSPNLPSSTKGKGKALPASRKMREGREALAAAGTGGREGNVEGKRRRRTGEREMGRQMTNGGGGGTVRAPVPPRAGPAADGSNALLSPPGGAMGTGRARKTRTASPSPASSPAPSVERERERESGKQSPVSGKGKGKKGGSGPAHTPTPSVLKASPSVASGNGNVGKLDGSATPEVVAAGLGSISTPTVTETPTHALARAPPVVPKVLEPTLTPSPSPSPTPTPTPVSSTTKLTPIQRSLMDLAMQKPEGVQDRATLEAAILSATKSTTTTKVGMTDEGQEFSLVDLVRMRQKEDEAAMAEHRELERRMTSPPASSSGSGSVPPSLTTAPSIAKSEEEKKNVIWTSRDSEKNEGEGQGTGKEGAKEILSRIASKNAGEGAGVGESAKEVHGGGEGEKGKAGPVQQTTSSPKLVPSPVAPGSVSRPSPSSAPTARGNLAPTLAPAPLVEDSYPFTSLVSVPPHSQSSHSEEEEETCCAECRAELEREREELREMIRRRRGEITGPVGTGDGGSGGKENVPAITGGPTKTTNAGQEQNANDSAVGKKKKKKGKKKGGNGPSGGDNSPEVNGVESAQVAHQSNPVPPPSTPTSPNTSRSNVAPFTSFNALKSALVTVPRANIPFPSDCCPPDRCTKDHPALIKGREFDLLLEECFLAGYRYELIDNLVHPLTLIRDRVAKEYLLMGGRMCSDAAGREPKDMHAFVRLAEAGMWSGANKEVRRFTTRTLAVSLQKLVEVFRAQLGKVCVCRLTLHRDVLEHAKERLTECELADRKVPIELPAMDQQSFMKWAHVQLRAKKLSGKEWEGLERSYRVSDFLLSFADAFDAAIDRMVDRDPYVVAEDVMGLIHWLGGVRTFDVAVRLGTGPIPEIPPPLVGVDVVEAAKAEEGRVPEKEVLAGWGRVLDACAARGNMNGIEVAENEKKKGNALFVAGEYQKSLVCFIAASTINPLDATFWTNAAAARIKLGSTQQYSEAVSDCTYALALDKKNVKALFRRGMALALLGCWNQAIIDLSELVRLSPDNQPALDALAWAKKRRPA
ncbi:hypothetical protein T439DRAFT_347679 [Meredithblackwellia eburnea MCA 4105]